MTLLMDPITNSFITENGFFPLDHFIDKIEKQYGIKAAKSADSIQFDPETFILNLAVDNNAGKSSGAERFRIYYHPEKRVIEYERINPPGKDRH